jgi:hypothetical protein
MRPVRNSKQAEPDLRQFNIEEWLVSEFGLKR